MAVEAKTKKSSNWASLKSSVSKKSSTKHSKVSRISIKGPVAKPVKQKRKKETEILDEDKAKYVAMDCEMVGVGTNGKKSALARCSLVNFDCETIYDKYVQPTEKITDYRTFVSGIRPKHLKNAVSFQECQREVSALLEGQLLVGHALKNDLKALMLTHPASCIRDTSAYRPLMGQPGQGGKFRPRSLKVLAEEVLGASIQEGEHSSVQDASATMLVFRQVMKGWEAWLAKKSEQRQRVVDKKRARVAAAAEEALAKQRAAEADAHLGNLEDSDDEEQDFNADMLAEIRRKDSGRERGGGGRGGRGGGGGEGREAEGGGGAGGGGGKRRR